MDSTATSAAGARGPSPFLRFRSWIRYGTSLRAKLVFLVLVIVVLVVGALYAFSILSLRTSIAAIYEQRARSVASVISKSIEEKDYILYYSDDFDRDIAQLLERYESVVGITAVGLSARGFVVVASTDPTIVRELVTEEERVLFDSLREIETRTIQLGGETYLRAYHPLRDGSELIGVVVVDMSLEEQARYIRQLSWRFGLGTIVGSILLGGLLYLVLSALVTRPVGRLAVAMGAVAERKYDVEVPVPFRRIPGTQQRDEVSQLVDGFNLMTKVIHSHEQELLKLVVLDELTGAYTIDHLRAELDRELAKTRRYKHPTSVLVIDVAGLDDRSNEEHDRALVRTASFLVSNLRNVDVLYRISEYRFVSMLPETPPAGASVAAERLKGLVPDLTAHFDDSITVSIGSLGWSEEGAPEVDVILERLRGPIDTLRG